MSGIAGWVDFRRDIRDCAPVLRAMTGTLACRGPDAEGVWLSEHCGIGQRSLGASGGARRPVSVEHGGDLIAAIGFTGALGNARECRAELAGRGYKFRTELDDEVALAAYLEWGRAAANRLDGSFGLAIWDERDQQLLLIRDRVGMKPLYYYPLADGLLFGSEPKAILAHPKAEAVLDAEGLSELLAYAGSPDRGFFAGLRKVRPAHTLLCRETSRNEQRYWQYSAKVHVEDLASTVETTRGLLGASVRRSMNAREPVGFLLSGGLDSSAVVGLAAETGEAPKTYTVTFQDESAQFAPDAVRATRDAPFAREMAEHVGADHEEILVSTDDLLDPVARAATIRAKDAPSMLGDMNTALYLLCQAGARYTKVALSGEIADAIFGGNVYSSVRDPVALPWMDFHAKHAGHPYLGGGLLDRTLLAKLDLVSFGADLRRQTEQETPIPDGISDEERRARKATYLQLTRWMENQVEHSERYAMAAGIDVRLPFTDHQLLDYVFNVPTALKFFDGREKSLLRAATANQMPDSVLTRQKSPFPVSAKRDYQRLRYAELAEVLDDSRSPVLPLLDADAVRAKLADPTEVDGGWVARTDVEMLLTMNTWLREYGVRIAL
ncbi:asparagine synthase (glutamine-hydrolysing) [Tamaricihabitans halophyticus]|uniref:asparagine synthase (glutamine-hydrolyzing) n=1 Tax=Tamaricihabitans halophyticus TaxID=1262583 RepID=A0A4R2R419_9PSEU|nr:asparagine synthase (glutamine-hydrolyzing) [Tamaricihabitans halophyticus]TCP56767.1 asparagine synthase (glutamine-hydrolysing) [Tamaricihabitans halophyticus]